MDNQIEKIKINLGETVKKGGLFAKMKDKFFLVPKNVRLISLSVFIFMLGWGLGGDTFYSVFIDSIVDNVLRVSLFGAFLPFIKFFVAPAAGEFNDDCDKKHIFVLSKIFYIISSIFYVTAGILKSPRILLVAVLFNGFGSSSTFVTYYSAVHENSNKNHSESSWGLFFSGMNCAYVVGALLSAVLVQFINLPFLYIFIAIFSILSLLIDCKISFNESKSKETSTNHFESFKKFFKKCFSIMPMKKMIKSLKAAPRPLWNGLGYEMLYSLLDYLSLLFIPLISLSNGLGLWQIAIIFAAMRSSYVFNFFTSGWDEGFNKKLFIAIVLVFLSGLFILLGFDLSFLMILIVSFCISFGLSVMRPVISSMVTENAKKENIGVVSGAEQFAAYLGNIMGSIGFGVLSSIFTMNIAFFIVGLSLAVLAGLSFFKRGKEKIKKITNK